MTPPTVDECPHIGSIWAPPEDEVIATVACTHCHARRGRLCDNGTSRPCAIRYMSHHETHCLHVAVS